MESTPTPGEPVADRPDTFVQPGHDAVAASQSAEASSTAMGILTQNMTGAARTAQYESLQFALLLGNDRNDDEPQVLGAAGESQVAQSFLNLFQESFTAFKQSQDYQMLLAGQATPWRPVLRDATGKLIGGFPTVLLNPTWTGPARQPVVQIVLPQHDWLSQVPPRHQTAAATDNAHRPLTLLDRPQKIPANQTLRRLLGDDAERADSISTALLTRTDRYDPLVPAEFARQASGLEPELAGQPAGWLGRLFPLHRVNVLPDLALVATQRIDEQAFEQHVAQQPLRLSPTQQLALLRGDHLARGQQTLSYNSFTNRLDTASPPLLLRGYSPDTEQLLSGMLTLEHIQLGGTPAALDKAAFVAGYKQLHHKGDQYDPTDPVAYYTRLEALLQRGLPAQADPQQTGKAIGRLLDASRQYSQLFQVQTVDTVKQTLTSANAPLPTTALRELLSLGLTPINEKVLFDQQDGLRTYKGVPLSPEARKALLRGERLELTGLQDGRRGSLYRASITLDATRGQPQEQTAGNGEQLLTSKPTEAAAHQPLTGSQGGENEPTPRQTTALRTSPVPMTVPPAHRPRH